MNDGCMHGPGMLEHGGLLPPGIPLYGASVQLTGTGFPTQPSPPTSIVTQ